VSDVPVADLALRNAKVVTFTDELAPLTAAARRTADLDGRVVLPGLNDSHIRAMRAGLDWARTLH